MLYSLPQVGVGGVVGIVVAIVALVGVFAAVLFVCYRRKSGGRQQQLQLDQLVAVAVQLNVDVILGCTIT